MQCDECGRIFDDGVMELEFCELCGMEVCDNCMEYFHDHDEDFS